MTRLSVARARPQRGRGKNKLEQSYEDTVLYPRKLSGEILDYKYEAIKLRLADNTTYTPDYMVTIANGEIEMHEVKGFWQDDARVKIKVAAEIYPFRFVAITKERGAWQYEEI